MTCVPVFLLTSYSVMVPWNSYIYLQSPHVLKQCYICTTKCSYATSHNVATLGRDRNIHFMHVEGKTQ